MPKKILSKTKLSLFVFLVGCGPQWPDFPEVWQCGYSIKFNKFRCVNTKTKEEMNLPLSSTRMEGAQCLSLRDYQKAEDWTMAVKKMAEERCK